MNDNVIGFFRQKTDLFPFTRSIHLALTPAVSPATTPQVRFLLTLFI